MYRLVILYGSEFGESGVDDQRAVDLANQVVDAVATACDAVIGRPLTEEHDMPYLLLWEPNVDPEGFEAYMARHVLREGVRAVVIPQPWSEAPLQ